MVTNTAAGAEFRLGKLISKKKKPNNPVRKSCLFDGEGLSYKKGNGPGPQQMTLNLKNTLRIASKLGVLATLLAVLSISSTQISFEECAAETASQEIELILERRVDAPRNSSHQLSTVRRDFRTIKLSRNRFFVAARERTLMNGLGTHLLI